MNQVGIALTSALAGSVLTGVFSFFVKGHFERRTEGRQEHRLAYTYLVRVAEFVAVKRVVTAYCSILDTVMKSAIKDKYPPEEGSVGDVVCVAVAENFKKALDDDDKQDQLKSVALYIEEFLKIFQTTYMFDIKEDALSKLPKDTLLAYNLYCSSIRMVYGILKVWNQFIETRDANMISSRLVHEHWLYIKDAGDDADKLLITLARYGRVSLDDLEPVIKVYYNRYWKKITEANTDNERLKEVAVKLKKTYPDWFTNDNSSTESNG